MTINIYLIVPIILPPVHYMILQQLIDTCLSMSWADLMATVNTAATVALILKDSEHKIE